MAKRVGTMRGRLFKTPRAARHRLKNVRDLLNWAYASNKSEAELGRSFLRWYRGVTERLTPPVAPPTIARLVRRAAKYPWADIQKGLRDQLVAVLDPVYLSGFEPGERVMDKISGREVSVVEVGSVFNVPVPRALFNWQAPDGKTYFHYSAETYLAEEPQFLAAQAVEMMLSDLSGVNVEAVKACAECHRYFVSDRPTRGRYCSIACRNRGYLKAHGFKPPKKSRRKEVNLQPAQKA